MTATTGGTPARGRRVAGHLAFALLVFGAWEIGGRLTNPILLPPFSSVVVAFTEILLDGSLIEAMGESLRLLFIGFGLAAVVAFAMGIVIGRYRSLDQMLSPFINALYATPDIALVPLILVWFGFGLPGRIVVVFLAAFFAILYNVYAGVKDAPRDLIEVSRSFGVRSELGILRAVVLPSAVPFIMAGLRLGIGRAVVGMAIAEVFLRLGGIGGLIMGYGSSFRTDFLIASIISLPLLGIALTKIFARIEHRFEYWRTV
ncbi:MAG TPA: ABC transporter permease [Candidatus Limnocylindria bacterium]|nr:ABC transporter permease [Candidatus Limnocylindria bacterium]